MVLSQNKTKTIHRAQNPSFSAKYLFSLQVELVSRQKVFSSTHRTANVVFAFITHVSLWYFNLFFDINFVQKENVKTTCHSSAECEQAFSIEHGLQTDMLVTLTIG
jgi:hypothetical protein